MTPWTWRWTVVAAVLVGLLGSAAALVAHEPAGADDVYRKREVCVARCMEVKP